MTIRTATRRPSTRRPNRPHLVPRTRAVDDAGRVWEHANPLRLCGWLAKRNELLRTIAARAGGN